jgi:kinesin family member 20
MFENLKREPSTDGVPNTFGETQTGSCLVQVSGTIRPIPLRVDVFSPVPRRHVRLTEILESFFTGEGRVVMIVNVNPHDTGFQENSQVMEFSALATQVQTSALDRLRQPIMKSFEAMKTKVQHSSGSIGRSQNKITVILPNIAPKSQQVPSTLDSEAPEPLMEMVEEDLEVVEGLSLKLDF